MSDAPDRDTEPCPDKVLTHTLTQVCGHCGGMLGRTVGIPDQVKHQLDAIMASERDVLPHIIFKWDSEVVSVSPNVH